MISVTLATTVLSFLTLTGGVVVILLLICIASGKGILVSIRNFFSKNGLLFSWIVALTATSGSLFYSEIAGLEPCKLCWFQRIFMYPLVILLGIAYFRRDERIGKYVIPMSIIGALIAGYHYTIQRLEFAAACSEDVVSCASSTFLKFGYITIPMMALTAFLMIGGFL